jgi:hypothetical protein
MSSFILFSIFKLINLDFYTSSDLIQKRSQDFEKFGLKYTIIDYRFNT